MKSKETIQKKITGYEQDACLYRDTFLLLKGMSVKHNIELDKLLVGMQGGEMVIQVYDTGAYPVWQTLEIIKWQN